MRIVIIGNGVAGMEAALALKKREPSLDVTIVSEESDHFFSRPALMWVFSGQMCHRDIEPLERDAYERHGIVRRRARAIGIDTRQRLVLLKPDREPLPYDKLMIACGSRPRSAPWPGSQLRGIGHFVTLQDLEWLEREVYGAPNERPPGSDAHVASSEAVSPYWPRQNAATVRGSRARRPAVIGGGLIGIEVVEMLHAAKLGPRFFVREEWFWPMALDANESAWVAKRLHEHGIEVHFEHTLECFEGDQLGNVCGVRTDRGRYEIDLGVVAIGVVPNTSWLEGSAVERDQNGAIRVGPNFATSAPDVFAAGDCAAVRTFDGLVQCDTLWYTARAQGRAAASALLGDDVSYTRGTYYNSSKLMDIEHTTVGRVNMGLPDQREWYFEETEQVRSSNRIVTQGGQVIGFNLLGRRWDNQVLCRFIEQRRSLPWVLEHLHEAAFDTEFVPPMKISREHRSREPRPHDLRRSQ